MAVIINQAALIGSITVTATASEFRLPIFKAADESLSNACYIQNLDSTDAILSFSEFDIDGAELIEVDGAFLQRSIGDQAIWCFSTEAMGIVWGTREQLAGMLKKRLDEFLSAPFLHLQISRFCDLKKTIDAERTAFDFLSTQSSDGGVAWRNADVLLPAARRAISKILNLSGDRLLDIDITTYKSVLEVQIPKNILEKFDRRKLNNFAVEMKKYCDLYGFKSFQVVNSDDSARAEVSPDASVAPKVLLISIAFDENVVHAQMKFPFLTSVSETAEDAPNAWIKLCGAALTKSSPSNLFFAELSAEVLETRMSLYSSDLGGDEPKPREGEIAIVAFDNLTDFQTAINVAEYLKRYGWPSIALMGRSSFDQGSMNSGWLPQVRRFDGFFLTGVAERARQRRQFRMGLACFARLFATLVSKEKRPLSLIKRDRGKVSGVFSVSVTGYDVYRAVESAINQIADGTLFPASNPKVILYNDTLKPFKPNLLLLKSNGKTEKVEPVLLQSKSDIVGAGFRVGVLVFAQPEL